MSEPRGQPPSREIHTRIVVEGELRLVTPTALGNGDAESLTDMPLLLDTAGEKPLPLLTGTSIAGALRNYLRAREQGFYQPEVRQGSLATELFGGVKGDAGSGDTPDQGGEQSRLIVDDALGTVPVRAEVRDGVRIDNRTRTAEDKFKYDLELLPAGTTFRLRFELLISDGVDEARLRQALALALHGLERGEIALGKRKTRGYGRCEVSEWRVITYRLRNARADLLAWLSADHTDWGYPPPSTTLGTAGKALNAAVPAVDERRRFMITATFDLASPLLVRSDMPLQVDQKGKGPIFAQPDVSQLRNSQNQAVLPGTSLAGVLRAQAQRIVNTIGATLSLDTLFGRDMHLNEGDPSASRLVVYEAVIDGGSTLVQNRVAIDRFTGGALDTALFSEAPQIGGRVQLTFELRDPEPAEKGLLLLLLKDLWTGDLPVGGTSSIGRGRLRGIAATINDEGQYWELRQQERRIELDAAARTAFETYVQALNSGSGAIP